jgi:hypothetical protein
MITHLLYRLFFFFLTIGPKIGPKIGPLVQTEGPIEFLIPSDSTDLTSLHLARLLGENEIVKSILFFVLMFAYVYTVEAS